MKNTLCIVFPLGIAILSSAAAAWAITPNTQETNMAYLITSNPGQQRPSMTYHPILNMVARFRARDLATRDYFAHVDLDGYGPNYVVETSTNLLGQAWHTNGVQQAGNTFSAGQPADRSRYFQLKARQVDGHR